MVEKRVAMSEPSVICGIQGIVFDAVGTLIEPQPSVALVYVEAARRQGIELDAAVVQVRFRQEFSRDEIDRTRDPLATDEATERRRWSRIVAKVLHEVPSADRAFRELWDHFGRPDSWRCFPDVAPTLSALHDAGIAVWIASNFDARLRGVVAGRPELSGWADRLVISSEVGFRKPHATFFRAVCLRLGMRPERILCVGDDPEIDVRGAISAGLRGVLLDRHGMRPDDLPSLPDLSRLVAAVRAGGGD
jgi:putative hydrolase of the HAD superfamily